jgi:hypothetical protein
MHVFISIYKLHEVFLNAYTHIHTHTHIHMPTYIHTGLVNAANNSKRKQKHGLKVSIYELRDVLLSIEPNKRMQDVGECVYRGFAMMNAEDAMSILGAFCI